MTKQQQQHARQYDNKYYQQQKRLIGLRTFYFRVRCVTGSIKIHRETVVETQP